MRTQWFTQGNTEGYSLADLQLLNERMDAVLAVAEISDDPEERRQELAHIKETLLREFDRLREMGR